MVARILAALFPIVIVLSLGPLAAQEVPLGLPCPECPPTYAVAVWPDGSAIEAQANVNKTVTFTVMNTGTNTDTYIFTCSVIGNETCVSVSPTSKTLSGGLDWDVSVTFTAGAVSTSGTVTLQAYSNATGVNDYGRYSVSNVPGPAPIVDVTPYNYEVQDMGRCAAACFAVTYAQSTVPYFSLDTPRSVTLAYHGDRVDPKPFIHVNVQHGGSASDLPTAFWLEAKKADGTFVTFLNGETKLRFAPSTMNLRLAGQFSATANGVGLSGVYGLDIVVTAEYAAGPRTVVNSKKLVIVNENGAPIARGWTLAGVQRLYLQSDSSALITDGVGSAAFFQKSGTTYTTPIGEFSKLVTGTPAGGSGWTRLFPDSTKIVFNTAGRMIEVQDRFNNVATVTYDGSNRVWQVKDPLNLAITLSYGTNGLSTIQDPGGRVTTVTVDGSKRLTTIRDPDNVSTTFGYDASLRLATVTDRRGATTTLGYDPQSGKLVSATAPPVLLFDGTTASPVTTLMPWQKGGVPYGPTSPTAYTAPGKDTVYARITDPGGHITRFTMNRWGQPLQVTDPLGRLTTVSYETRGLASYVAYPSGGADYFSYDANGLPTYIQLAGQSATNIRYGTYAQADSVWGPGQPALYVFLGASGRVDSSRVGGVAMTRYTYDSRGRMTIATDPLQHLLVQRWFAGQNGNRSKDSVPGGRVITYGYDSRGRVTSVSRTGLPTRTIAYDLLNRDTVVYNGVNPAPTRFRYDSLFLTEMTDPAGQVYRFTYNALGWLGQRTDPLGRVDQYQYDRDGTLRRWTNRRGQLVTFVYDPLHRRVKKSGANTSTDSLSYSTDGRVITAISPAATVTAYHNIRGAPDSVKTVLGGFTYWHRYAYTLAGLLDSVGASASSGATFLQRKYAYHTARGTLDSLRLGASWTRFGFNGDLQSDSTELPGGDVIKRQFNSIHQLASITNPTGPYAGTVNRSLNFDLVGRANRQYSNSDTRSLAFGYNGLGRVVADTFRTLVTTWPECDWDIDRGWLCSDTTVTSDWQVDSVHSFGYDPLGNRTDHAASYSPAGSSRLASFSGCNYTLDLDGNVTTRSGCVGQTVAFGWAAENRLDTVVVNGTQLTFAYDAVGRLVRKDVNGAASRYFLWAGEQLWAELDAAGQKVAEYSFYPGLDRLHAVVLGSVKYFAHADGLGNIIALTDSGKAVRRTYGYDEWGQPAGGTDHLPFSSRDRARWKGALWLGPEVELYYMRARWYEPFTGRFLSEDPLGLAAGINPYIFAGSDPVNGADPSGLDDCTRVNPADPCSIAGPTVTASPWPLPYQLSRDCDNWSASPLTCPDAWGPGTLSSVYERPGEGGGADVGMGPGVQNLGPQGPSCGGAWLGALAATAGDVAALAGVGLAVKGARALTRLEGLARLGSKRGARAAAELARRTGGANGLRNGALAAYGAAGNIGWSALEASAFDEELGLWDVVTDFIPVVNAGKAWYRVYKLGCF